MKLFYILAVSVFLSSCSNSDDIGRDEAKELIESYFNSYGKGEQLVYFSESGGEDGYSQGFWVDGSLTEKGMKYFNWVNTSPPNPSFSPKKEFKHIIDITGINLQNKDENSRIVEFTLSNENLTGPPRRFALASCKGSANINLFDDGWRINKDKVSMSCDYSSTLKLSAIDQKSLDDDIAQAEINAQNEFEKSNTVTITRNFSCSLKKQYGGVDNFNLTITDVGLSFSGVGGDASWSYRDISSINTDLAFLTGNHLNVKPYSGRSKYVYSEHCPDWNVALATSIEFMKNWKEKYYSPEDH